LKYSAGGKSLDLRRKSAILPPKSELRPRILAWPRPAGLKSQIRSINRWVFCFPPHSRSEWLSDGVASTPRTGCVSTKKESAVKPGSVVDSHSSGMRVAAQLKRPTRKPHVGHMCGLHAPRASLFGLAPGGVCRAEDVATRAVRSYRTISPLPAPLARHLGGIFLLHCPWARAPQALPGTVPYGARTFLHVLAHTATAWPTLGLHHTQIWL